MSSKLLSSQSAPVTGAGGASTPKSKSGKSKRRRGQRPQSPQSLQKQKLQSSLELDKKLNDPAEDAAARQGGAQKLPKLDARKMQAVWSKEWSVEKLSAADRAILSKVMCFGARVISTNDCYL